MVDLRWTKLVVLAVVLVFATGVLYAADGKRVTLQLSDTPVIDVIDYMFKDTGYKYTIEPGVSGRISVGIKDLPLEEAVKAVADASNLEYTVGGGRYIFKPRPKVEPIAAEVPNPAQSEEMLPDVNYEPPVAYEDPVYYGSYFQEPYPYVYDIFGFPMIEYPYNTFIISPGGYYHRVPDLVVPPELRSPSYQRFLDQMYSVHSVPGYPVWKPYDVPYGRPFFGGPYERPFPFWR